jgi:hypothetical protein
VDIEGLRKNVQDWLSVQKLVANSYLTIKIDTEKGTFAIHPHPLAIGDQHLDMIAEDFFKKFARRGSRQSDRETAHWLLRHAIGEWSQGARTFREFIEEWRSPTSIFFKECKSRLNYSHVLNDALSRFGCERWA